MIEHKSWRYWGTNLKAVIETRWDTRLVAATIIQFWVTWLASPFWQHDVECSDMWMWLVVNWPPLCSWLLSIVLCWLSKSSDIASWWANSHVFLSHNVPLVGRGGWFGFQGNCAMQEASAWWFMQVLCYSIMNVNWSRWIIAVDSMFQDALSPCTGCVKMWRMLVAWFSDRLVDDANGPDNK